MFFPTSMRLTVSSVRRAATPSRTSAAAAAAAVQAAESRAPLPPLESYTEVPEYYIKRAEIRSSDEPGVTETLQKMTVMNDLQAATLRSDDAGPLKALHRIQHAKVPKEIINEEGDLVHPSGFVVPTPETDVPLMEMRERDIGVVTAAVAERVREEEQLMTAFGSGAAEASTQRLHGKVPVEVDVDGSGDMVHPSGFKPPAPESSFADGFHSEYRTPRRHES